MSIEEKCKSINVIVANYFSLNKSISRIRACELFEESFAMRKLFSSAKTMRDLVRELDSRKTLQIIPYLEKEEVGCGRRNWFFTKMK